MRDKQMRIMIWRSGYWLSDSRAITILSGSVRAPKSVENWLIARFSASQCCRCTVHFLSIGPCKFIQSNTPDPGFLNEGSSNVDGNHVTDLRNNASRVYVWTGRNLRCPICQPSGIALLKLESHQAQTKAFEWKCPGLSKEGYRHCSLVISLKQVTYLMRQIWGEKRVKFYNDRPEM